MSGHPFPRVTIVGLGLMGGSLIKALRGAPCRRIITGVDRDTVLAEADPFLDYGYAPEAIDQALDHTDLVVLATPVRTILGLLPSVLSRIRPGTVVTDLGSTKTSICSLARQAVPDGVTFVGGHPLCGAETAGFGHSRAGLYQDAPWILTPDDRDDSALLALSALIRSLGGRPRILRPQTHDAILARTSHLPQFLAVALARLVEATPGARELTGQGYRDMTRIAASPAPLWADIAAENRLEIAAAMGTLIEDLERMRSRILCAD